MNVTNKIPVPDRIGKGRKRLRYPFHELKRIGDSFYVPGVDARHGVYSSLKSYNEKVAANPISITIRTEGDGIRVWKISSNKKKK